MSLHPPAPTPEATYIISLDEDLTGATLDPERRTSERHPCQDDGLCQPVPSWFRETLWHTRVRDISMEGIGLLADRRFEPGTILEIRLTSKRWAFDKNILARVVRVAEYGGKTWIIGCQLLGNLTESELKAWIALAKTASTVLPRVARVQ